MPRKANSEDAIGHGFLELIRATSPRSHAIEITSSSYEDGLSKLAEISSGEKPHTEFSPTGLVQTGLEDIDVMVDGVSVPFETVVGDDDSITVVLEKKNAGTYGSKVSITACNL